MTLYTLTVYRVTYVLVCCHNIRKGARRFLLRFKGFGPAFDEWKEEADVSEVLV